MTFSPPTQDDNRELASKFVSIATLISEEYEYELTHDVEDLEYIQRVIDEGLIDFTNQYALDCLGMVFGGVIIDNNDGWDWWISDDEYGREAVLRYKKTSLQISALSMIGKRLINGEEIDVVGFYRELMNQVENLLRDGEF